MTQIWIVEIVVMLAVVDITSTAIFNTTLKEVDNSIKPLETRRQLKKGKDDRSTSSSSGDLQGTSDVSNDGSLQLLSTSATSSDDDKKKFRPKSSKERRGWRKWHRKCTPCPNDMRKKWRDPTINWICGAYQRARRSFKSMCMMHYRNCQDGTMFVKIQEHRCPNETGKLARPYHGETFFYEYRVKMSGDDSKSTSDSSSKEDGSYELM